MARTLLGGGAPPLLLNLKDDQGKKRNQIAEQPGIAEDLQRKLSAWAAQLDSADYLRAR